MICNKYANMVGTRKRGTLRYWSKYNDISELITTDLHVTTLPEEISSEYTTTRTEELQKQWITILRRSLSSRSVTRLNLAKTTSEWRYEVEVLSTEHYWGLQKRGSLRISEGATILHKQLLWQTTIGVDYEVSRQYRRETIYSYQPTS